MPELVKHTLRFDDFGWRSIVVVRMPKDVTFVNRYYDLLRLPFDYLTSTDEHLDFGDVQDRFTFFHSNVIKKFISYFNIQIYYNP